MENSQQKKLLFVATRQFWPISSGKDITLYHNCRGLHELGYEIYLICFADETADKNRPVPAFIHEVVYVDVPPIWRSAGRIFFKSILGGVPIQNSLFFNRKTRDWLWSYYCKIKPSAVVIDMVRLAQYGEILRNEKVNKILIEDDLLAKRYRRQIESTSMGSISGYMAPSLPGIVNKLTSMGPIRNAVLRGEIRRLEQYEEKCAALFDHITFISRIETEEFNRKYGTDKAIQLTNGADIVYCSGGVPDAHRENSLSVVGNFFAPANRASLEWVNAEVMPRLPEGVKLYAVGKYPEELKEKIDGERIVMLGFVDDVRSVVKSTDVYLAPIVFGTGIKSKIIEAMAMGMPVVTNSIGAEGLDVESGRELIIAEEAQEIADAVTRLLSCEDSRRMLAETGREYVVNTHDWNVVFRAFKDMGL